MSTDLLMQLAGAIAGGQIKVIDLTQTLRPSTPVIGLAAAVRQFQSVLDLRDLPL